MANNGGVTGEISNNLFVFDPKDNMWVEKVPMNQSRMHCMLNAIENKLYAIRGRTAINKPVPSIEVYDTRTDQWSVVENVSLSNHSLGASFVENNDIFTGIGNLDNS